MLFEFYFIVEIFFQINRLSITRLIKADIDTYFSRFIIQGSILLPHLWWIR